MTAREFTVEELRGLGLAVHDVQPGAVSFTAPDRGGFIGVTMFPPFLKKGTESTVDDYVEANGVVCA